MKRFKSPDHAQRFLEIHGILAAEASVGECSSATAEEARASASAALAQATAYGATHLAAISHRTTRVSGGRVHRARICAREEAGYGPSDSATLTIGLTCC
jgi:hypothetical protein